MDSVYAAIGFGCCRVGRGSIEARENFLAVNLLDLAGIILGQVIPVLCAVFLSPALTLVIPAAFIARAISVAIMFAFIARTEELSGVRGFDPNIVKELLVRCLGQCRKRAVGPILASVDQLFVGSTLGAAAVRVFFGTNEPCHAQSDHCYRTGADSVSRFRG